jgi:hypothetical protein
MGMVKVTLAGYTESLIDEMDRTGQADIAFGDGMPVGRARSRLRNAAKHPGFVIEKRLERDSMAGFGPPTGAVVATVVGWTT